MVNAPRGYKAYGEVSSVFVEKLNNVLNNYEDFVPSEREIIYQTNKGKQQVLLFEENELDKSHMKKGDVYFDCIYNYTRNGETIVGIKYVTNNRNKMFLLFELQRLD